MREILFFNIRADVDRRSVFPMIDDITDGLQFEHKCSVDGIQFKYAYGPIKVALNTGKGREWSDIIRCGSYPFFVVSGAALDQILQCKVDPIVYYPVEIVGSLPGGLRKKPRPDYFWIDGKVIQGAVFNYEKSGYLNVSFCEECGHRSCEYADWKGIDTDVLVKGSWKGLDLFTTADSPTAFHCTENLKQKIEANGLKNFSFRRVGYG